MDQSIQVPAPIIPVIDERLSYIPDTPREHKAKIDQYNELLEDIYQREVELTRIKSSLADMRQEITEDAQHLSNTGVLPPIVAADTRSESESDDAENVLSDTSPGTSPRRNSFGKYLGKGKKVKGKFGRLGNRHSKVPDAQLTEDWDYELELGRTGKKLRRGSDSSVGNVRV